MKKIYISFLFFSFVYSFFNAQVFAEEAFSEVVVNGFDPEQKVQEQRALHEFLMSERLSVDKPGIVVPLNQQDKADIGMQTGTNGITPAPEERRYRVGVVKNIAKKVDFSNFTPSSLPSKPTPFNFGMVKKSSDGGLVWTTKVESSGAVGLRMHFSNFRLPDGAEVYVFNEEGEAFGPYIGQGPHEDGDFWSQTISGSQVFIQLRFFNSVTVRDLKGLHFLISDVGHVGSRFKVGSWPLTCPSSNQICVQPNKLESACRDDSQSVECTVGSSLASAIAHYQFISGPYIYICTGGLVADTDYTSQISYFLTANHCLSRGKDAKNVEAFFNYSSCGSSSLAVSGANIIRTNRTGDYTLLELKETLPTGSVLLGWNSMAVAYEGDTVLHRISHPAGDPQTYSRHIVNTTKGTCSSWSRGPWIYSVDESGAVEGGSSGALVVTFTDINGLQIVGQLSGGCGTNVNDVCDSARNATVDGAFASYYPEVSQWLDPITSCQVTESTETSCNDGMDNDCDGTIDNADSDCPVIDPPSCSLLPKGDMCTSDSQCCSNNCKGRSGNKTCK